MTELSKSASSTLEAIRALKLGKAHAFENSKAYDFKDGGVVLFTIVMDNPSSATEHRLKKLRDRVEAKGYRVLDATIHQATLRVICRPSTRNIGTVERVARDGDNLLLLLAGTLNEGIWTIPASVAKNRAAWLFTQPGDEVVIWRDHKESGIPASVSSFHNRTLPKVG